MTRRAPVALRELRDEWALFLCLATLVALLGALAAAGPALLDRLAGHALAARLEQEQRAGPGVTFRARFDPADVPGADLGEDLRAVGTVIEGAAPPPLRGALTPYATRVELPLVTARAPAGAVGLGLVYASDAPGRAAYAEGRPPDPDAGAVEVAVSTATRDTLRLTLGQRLPLGPGALRPVDATAVVVGFFRADDRAGPGAGRLWRELPLLARPSPYPPGALSWEARALVAPASVTALQLRAGATLTATWAVRLAPDHATAARLAADAHRGELERLLTRYPDDVRTETCGSVSDYGGMYCRIGPHDASALDDGTALPEALADFTRQWRQARVVLSFGLASLLAVGFLTAVAAARLAAHRRAEIHRLQRARGASAAALAGARAARTAPAALLGLAAGLAAAGPLAGPAPPAYRYGVLVAVLLWLPLPALTWHTLRDRGRPPDARRAAGRRIVAEATVLLLAASGVAALRTRGTAAEAGPDPLLAAVPALLGLATVVVLLRCYPSPLRLLARWSARRRGVVALVALRRAAREAPARAPVLLVLVVTLAAAVSGQLLTGTLADGRQRAAAWYAGADAAFLGAARHPGTARHLARLPGVRATVSVRQLRVDPTNAATGERHGVAGLLGVDGAELRTAAPGSAAGRALGALTGPARPDEIRVLATDARTGDVLTLAAHGRTLRLRVVGRLPDAVPRDAALGPVRSSTVSRDRLFLTDNRDLAAVPPTDFEQSALLLYGPRLDVRALRALVPRTTADAGAGELRIRAEEQADAAADGTVGVLVAAHTACTAAAALLALLALVLDLSLSAPARARGAAHLRVLGLGGTALTKLHLLHPLPVVAAAVVGGGALGLTLPALLGPALDLREFTGGPGDPPVTRDPLPVLAAAGGLLVLVAVAAAVERWSVRRRRLGAVLRLTEER